MTRETAQKHREAFNAFCEGKPVQFKLDGTDLPWTDTDQPRWDTDVSYRIKPREPREWNVRVFKSGECYSSNATPSDSPDYEVIRVREILPDETP